MSALRKADLTWLAGESSGKLLLAYDEEVKLCASWHSYNLRILAALVEYLDEAKQHCTHIF